MLSIRDEAVSKILTSGESGNDSDTDFMTAGEGSAKEKCGDMLGQKIAKPTVMIASPFLGSHRRTDCVLEMFPCVVLAGDLVEIPGSKCLQV